MSEAQRPVRAAVSGWLGTAFMDFQLYSLGAALVFHEIFFPEQSAAMALILAMGTYGAGYIAVLSVRLFSAKWATVLVAKSAVYYHHHDGDLHDINWRTANLCANWHICPGVAGDVTYYSGAGCRCGNFRGGDHAGGICAKRKRGIISSLVAMGTNCGTLSATAIWAVMFFALDRRTAGMGMAYSVPGECCGHDLCYLAANEPQRKPGI
jgi:MHS family metabolite:H+ symporter-like MFS transporter